MKNLCKILAFTFFLTVIISCNDDDKQDANVTYTTTLSGANETTPNASTATGTATLVFNTTTKTFIITVVHNIAAPTAGHIHKGAAGTNGGVVYPFTTLASPISYTSVALTAEQEADLNAGLLYVNLHSAAFSSGEIRGNLVKQANKSGY